MDHRALNEEFEEELTSFLEHVNEAQPEENSHDPETSD
jgi:hypothetical protein